jgi:hypothetical protein
MECAHGIQTLVGQIHEAGGPVRMMRASQLGSPVPGTFPAIASEFTD